MIEIQEKKVKFPQIHIAWDLLDSDSKLNIFVNRMESDYLDNLRLVCPNCYEELQPEDICIKIDEDGDLIRICVFCHDEVKI